MFCLFYLHVPTLLMVPCSTSHILTRLISLTLSHTSANCATILPIALQAELAYSERTFRHLPEVKHGTGDYTEEWKPGKWLGCRTKSGFTQENQCFTLTCGQDLFLCHLDTAEDEPPPKQQTQRAETRSTSISLYNIPNPPSWSCSVMYHGILAESSQHGQFNDS